MTRTVVALYDEFSQGTSAIKDLLINGFSRQDIGILANDVESRYSRFSGGIDESLPEAISAGEMRTVAGAGTLTGGLGGLLVDMVSLSIDGIGSVVAAGPMVAELVEPQSERPAGRGLNILGALIDLGIPEEQAHYYLEAVRRGSTLLTLFAAEHMTQLAKDILDRHSPVDIISRVEAWRESGWTGFDPTAVPLTLKEIEAEKQRFETMAADENFNSYQETFKKHFEKNYFGSDYSFNYYVPAYYLGYSLAQDENSREQDWGFVEDKAQEEWEKEHPGTWPMMKDAVRIAWEEVRKREND